MEGELTTYVCLSGCRSVFVYMLCMYVLRESYHLLLLSFSSAHVSVDPTVVVRVMLDWSQCCSQHNQNCEFCVFMFFACSIACTLRSVKCSLRRLWACGGGGVCVVVCACVLSKCLRVYIQNISVCAVKTPVSNVTRAFCRHTEALWMYTRWFFFSAKNKEEKPQWEERNAHTQHSTRQTTTTQHQHHTTTTTHHHTTTTPHHTHKHTQTHQHTKTQRHKDTNTQTHKHTNTHKHTQTHKHTNTHQHTPTHTKTTHHAETDPFLESVLSKSISVRTRKTVNNALQGHIFVEGLWRCWRANSSLYSDQLVSPRTAEDEQLCQVRRPTTKHQLGNNEWLLWWTIGADDNSTCGA